MLAVSDTLGRPCPLADAAPRRRADFAPAPRSLATHNSLGDGLSRNQCSVGTTEPFGNSLSEITPGTTAPGSPRPSASSGRSLAEDPIAHSVPGRPTLEPTAQEFLGMLQPTSAQKFQEQLSHQVSSRLREDPAWRQFPHKSAQEPIAKQALQTYLPETLEPGMMFQQACGSRSMVGKAAMNETPSSSRIGDVIYQPHMQRSNSQPQMRPSPQPAKPSPPSANLRPQVRASPTPMSGKPHIRPSPPSARSRLVLSDTSSLDGGSSACSSARAPRAEGSAPLQELVAAAKQMASKLGGGHPTVLRAREKIRQLRAEEAEFRADSASQWHFENIEVATEDVCAGAEIARLDSALKLARCSSDLGRTHAVVQHGTAKAKQLRRHMFLEAIADVESDHAQMMQLAADEGDFAALRTALNVGEGALGYNNRHIEDSRKAYREQRNSWHRQDWASLVGAHAEAMEHACNLGDPDLLEACIQAAMKSELGSGHALVLEGKKHLLQLKKDIRRRREDSRIEDYEQAFRRLSLEAEFDLEARREELSRAERQPPLIRKGTCPQKISTKPWRESLR